MLTSAPVAGLGSFAALGNKPRLAPAFVRTARCFAAPTTGRPFGHRHFFVGAKQKWGSNSCNKMLGDKLKKAMISRSGYRYPYLERQLFLRRCLPAQGWRSASHWRNSRLVWQKWDRETDPGKKASEAEEQDWYSRWEKQGRQQYDEFVKRIEEDPFNALFGRSNKWLGWISDSPAAEPKSEPVSSKTGQNAQPGATESEIKSTRQKEPQNSAKGNKFQRQNDHIQASPVGEATRTPGAEYEIDPITLHKIPRTTQNKADTRVVEANKTYDIPVKTSNSSKSSFASQTKELPTASKHGGKDWLAEPKLKPQENHSRMTTLPETSPDKHSRQHASMLESALDRRHLWQTKQNESPPKRALEYEPTEIKTEDVDLLRASDLRAAAGARGKRTWIDPVEKASRHKAMEDNFQSGSAQLEQRLQQEITDQACSQRLTQTSEGSRASSEKTDARTRPESPETNSESSNGEIDSARIVSDTAERFSTFASEKAKRYSAKMVPLKTQIDLMRAEYESLRQNWLDETRRLKQKKVKKLHEEEVQAQKSAMEAAEMRKVNQTSSVVATIPSIEDIPRGEGDVATNVHEFANRPRWYKQRALHAQDEMDKKLHQIAKDKAFVQEIRQIYEDSYGVISTEHRQSLLSNPLTQAKNPETHVLLKEDPSSSMIESGGLVSADVSGQVATGAHSELSQSNLSKRPALIQELGLQLRRLDALVNAQIQNVHDHSSSNLLVKSMAYKQNMVRIFQITSEIARAKPSAPVDLLDCALSAAKLSWQAHLITTNMLLQVSRKRASEGEALSQRLEASKEKDQRTESVPPFATTYRVLAYDLSTQRLSSAKTTSVIPFETEKPMTPLEALTKLNNPGKFLPQLMSLHNKGYDIVSGAPNILILKKVRQPVSHPSASPDEAGLAEDHLARPYHANPIDGTVSPTGNYASPTGFVNHDSVLTPEELNKFIEQQRSEQGQELQQQEASANGISSLPTSSSTNFQQPLLDTSQLPPINRSDADTVRRQEPVFSGQSRYGGWHNHRTSGHVRSGRKHQKRFTRRWRRRRVMRRMLLTGLLTAAACYAVGVGIELTRV